MSIVITVAAFAASGWFIVKRYERHLDAQIGPWIMQKVEPLPRRSRRRGGRN